MKNWYKLLVQRYLESFRWTMVGYDWSLVSPATIYLKRIRIYHQSDPRDHCAESLFPFPLKLLEWAINACM